MVRWTTGCSKEVILKSRYLEMIHFELYLSWYLLAMVIADHDFLSLKWSAFKKKKSVHFLLESCASFDLKIVGIIWKTSSHQRLLNFVLFFCFDCLNRECLSIDSYPDRPGNLEKLSWFKSFHCFLWSCLLELTFHVQKKDNAHCMQLAECSISSTWKT